MKLLNNFVWILSIQNVINKNDMKDFFPSILFFTISIIWLVIAYRYGDWKNWKLYYPTILFFWCGDLIYLTIFHDKPLWIFKNPYFSHYFTDFYDALTVFTCTILLFLPHFPNRLYKQSLYILLWASIYSIIELPFYLTGGIIYFNGWNYGWSVLHNSYQFILLAVHHKSPIVAWILSIIILILVMMVFGVSI